MSQIAAKIIGTGLATTGLIGAGLGIGSTYLSYIIGISIIIAILMIISLIKIKTETDRPGMPGVRCPVCASRGVETWVLPGKNCPKCGCECGW